MKYILITLFLVLIALCGKAQTVHIDTATQMAYVNIDSVKARFNDKEYCTRLYVSITSDNLTSLCSLHWVLRDRFGDTHDNGAAVISGSDYGDWDGNNQYPFEVVADILGLTTHD